VRRDDSFRLIPAEVADRLVFWGALAFVAIGYAWGGF